MGYRPFRKIGAESDAKESFLDQWLAAKLSHNILNLLAFQVSLVLKPVLRLDKPQKALFRLADLE